MNNPLIMWLSTQIDYWAKEKEDEARVGNTWYEGIAEGRLRACEDLLDEIENGSLQEYRSK